MIDTSAEYEVSGEEVATDTGTSTTPRNAMTSFGAYTGPTAQLPLCQPIHCCKGSWKTLALVTLSSPNSDKPLHLDYKIEVVTVELGHCSSHVVADLVQQQVGFLAT